MLISKRYKIEEKDQRETLEIIQTIGFEEALDRAYYKALYLVANSIAPTHSTEFLAWSHNLLVDSRKPEFADRASDLRTLASFYRKLAHKVYWYQRKADQIADMKEFIRVVK